MFRLFFWLKDLIRNKQFGALRSSNWRITRNIYLQRFPKCEACGNKNNLIVHHKKPFYLYPELEVNIDNLITLCEGKTMNCHFVLGHCFLNWKCYNPNIKSDIGIINNIKNNAKQI